MSKLEDLIKQVKEDTLKEQAWNKFSRVVKCADCGADCLVFSSDGKEDGYWSPEYLKIWSERDKHEALCLECSKKELGESYEHCECCHRMIFTVEEGSISVKDHILCSSCGNKLIKLMTEILDK